MSASILSFVPKVDLEPLANIESFIELCRTSEVLNAKSQFEKDIWETGYFKGQNKINRIIFSTLEASSRSSAEPVLPTAFLNFAKATIVYLHDKRPVTSQSTRIAALRCIEAALRELNKDSRPSAVDESVLDTAVELARNQVSAAVAYRIAGQLEYIAEFMLAKEFIPLRHRWKHGLKKPQEHGSRISIEALKARQDKLPSAATLRALGGIFAQSVEPADVVVSSFTSLMLCAPERINEVLRLRRNCIVEGDGEFRGRFGLRWPGSKGFEDTTKWIPTEMTSLAREAVSNIERTTRAAHELAVWYTLNPDRLYLHEDARHLKGKRVLSTRDIAIILWNDPMAVNSAMGWAQKINNLPRQHDGSRIGFLFEDVERAAILMLPATFPFMPGAPELLCQDSMALMRTNEMHSVKATYLCMFSCVDYSSITNPLGARTDRPSIFERFDYTEDDNSPIELNSHSLRHYLNMLAQAGGLSSSEIALFSGRKDVMQNRAYDHMSSAEVQAPISIALSNGFTSELEPMTIVQRNLVTRKQFYELGLTAAHATEYGWCSHDFASEPCQMYRDCMNCEEQECIKGDRQKEANLRLLKGETEYLLKQAQVALSEEEYGADNWVKHTLNTLARVNALLKIFEDCNVAEGARIRLDVSNAPLITSFSTQSIWLVKASDVKEPT